MSSHRGPGRHELGQNFLTDRATIARIVELVRARPGPIVEWGTGDGALTLELGRLGRPVEGVEIDTRRARALARRVGPHVCITEGDILRHAPPRGAVVVSNIPFHITTKVLRHLLASPRWSHAVLLAQWEVARKRAGVGGATLLTAQWWPWFDFRLEGRVPADCFTPAPSVDGGLFTIGRRGQPLVPDRERRAYQQWVAQVFNSPGRGLVQVLRRQGVPAGTARQLAVATRGRRQPLPRDLGAEQWATAYRSAHDRGGRHATAGRG